MFISMVSPRFSRKLGFCKVPQNYACFDNIREGRCFFPHAAVETRTLLWFGHGCTGNRMLATRTLIWFGHGCTGNCMLSKHERYYGVGMDALVTECSRNTNVIMAWAWMYW